MPVSAMSDYYTITNGKMLSFREEKMLNVTGRMDWER